MNRLSLVVSLILVAGIARAQYRDFMDTQGRCIRGRVVSFDAKSQVVTVERDNKLIAKVPLSTFSEADQTYIIKLQNQDGVRSSSKFKISCNRRGIKSWNEKQMGPIRYTDGTVEENQVVGKKDFDEIGYEVSFANRNNYAIAGLVLEYCIYYEQEALGKEDGEPLQGVLFGSVNLDQMAPSETKKITTGSVVVCKDETNASFLNARVLKGQVHGIALRLYLQEGGEKSLVREEFLPSGIAKDYAWSASSKVVGYNK